MMLKTDEPFVPETIREKIKQLQVLLDLALDLGNDICEWYEHELKSYDEDASMDNELYDPGTGIVVEGISYVGGIEALSVLQTANECSMERIGSEETED